MDARAIDVSDMYDQNDDDVSQQVSDDEALDTDEGEASIDTDVSEGWVTSIPVYFVCYQ